MEKNNAFSSMQGGFRIGKTTYTKVWTLSQIIEHAKINKNGLHVCYIDVKKAYDSVKHWGLRRVLVKYGLNPIFVKLIDNICLNNECSIATPYGPSETIHITRGVRQGCPLSPTLFILFLDPLMNVLESCQKGYTINKKNIPGSAFADDMVLTSSSNRNMQELFDITTQYFNYFGLEMCIDDRDKTVYTSNRGSVEGKTLLYNGKKVPWLKPSESYKYLGVYINLDLNWNKQILITDLGFIRHIAYLRRKCFTASQTAEILNLVVFPVITYRMCVVVFPDEYITKWDDMVRSLMAHKLHSNPQLACRHWYLQHKYGGYNLFKLKDLQIINTVSNYLNFAANSIDDFATAAVDGTFHESNTIQKLQEKLSKLKLVIAQNPAVLDDNYQYLPQHYIKSINLLNKIKENNINSISDFITEKGILFGPAHMQDRLKFKKNWTKSTQNSLKSEICNEKDPLNKARNHILAHINKYKIMDEIDPQAENNRIFFDEEEYYNAFEAFVDESYNKEKNESSFGVFFGYNNSYNCGEKTYGRNTLQCATFQGVEYTLRVFPKNQNLNIYMDRKSAIDMLNKLPLTPKESHHAHELSMLHKIQHLLSLRTGTTGFKQIYSHLNNNSTEEIRAKKEAHYKLMLKEHGLERTLRLIIGNEGADKLADEGMSKNSIKSPDISEWHNPYVLKSTRKVATARGETKGYITERYREHIKEQLRNEFKYDTLKNKSHYDDWMDADHVSPLSWSLIKSKNSEHEKCKKHMIKILHNALPTKDKIFKRILKEREKEDGNTYWQDKYKYIQNNLCVFCEKEPETPEHLALCSHKTVRTRYNLLYDDIQELTENSTYTWYLCDKTSSQRRLKAFTASLGCKGLIPKKFTKIFELDNNTESKDQITDIQVLIIQTHLDIWKHRNRKIFSENIT
jgi:Reverse transcriptase (RNA-dependent DNA polymerase)